jgi:tRNA nucleotidyltransferase (CCA-adding enzyme)
MPGFLRSVLGRIRPAEAEKRRARRLAARIISRIPREAVLVGSIARDTSLAGNGDLDIFVFFPEGESRELLEKEGLEIGKKALAGHNPVTHYAEHPYTKAKVGPFVVEVVPCFKVAGKPKSAVDRSPMHNEFVLRRLKEGQRDQVRLDRKSVV